MSTQFTTNQAQAAANRPGHHMHDSSEPLPGANKGQQTTIDYSPENIERLPANSDWQDADPANFGRTAQTETAGSGGGQNAFTTDRPLGVKPTAAGGVAIGGDSTLPEGRANAMDKVVGKTQKVMGKVLDNMDLHEKGELRETGGKAAAKGAARAAHD